MLELKNIYLSFEKELIINGNITVPDGQITVISGKSGSGKSTLLYDIAFITNQSKMEYTFYGNDISHFHMNDKQKLQKDNIAFVFQNVQLINSMNLIDNIQFFAYLTHNEFDEKKAREYLTDLNLYLDDSTPIRTLSGGEKQRLAIVCALMKDTPLIILDEPTAYLDYDNQTKLLDILVLLKQKYHKTILIASHDDSIKGISDNLYEIENQKIVQLKSTNNKELKSLPSKNHTYQKALQLFYHKNMKSNKWKNNLLILLITILFTFSSFILIFFEIYQNQINSKIQDIQSQQMILETSNPLDNNQLKELKYIEDVQDVKRFSPIETDEGYLLCPYLRSDYFYHYLIEQTHQSNIYGNYETYRKNKDDPITFHINQRTYHFSIPRYLNQSFEDYRGLSFASQVLYIPYKEYEEIISIQDVDLKSSTMFILTINDQKNYLKTIEKIMREYPQMNIQGNSNLFKLIDIQSQLVVFNQSSFMFMFYLFIIIVIILKILRQYQWRKETVFLEINGVSRKDLVKILIKEEAFLLSISFVVSLLVVNGIYVVLGLWNLEILSQVILCLSIESIGILICSCFINVFVKKLLPIIRVIKRY